jgi:hypothetical protein
MAGGVEGGERSCRFTVFLFEKGNNRGIINHINGKHVS